MQVVTQIIQGAAFKDSYMFYKESDGFVKVTQCKDCELTGYNLDLRDSNPCPNCGGDIKELSAPGRMKNGKWEIRTAFYKVDKSPDFYRKEEEQKSESKTNAGFFSRFI
jgi:hypothetical protein